MKKIFIVKCPKCGNKQKVSARFNSTNWLNNPVLDKKTKKCVYCGHSFRYKKRILKSL